MGGGRPGEGLTTPFPPCPSGPDPLREPLQPPSPSGPGGWLHVVRDTRSKGTFRPPLGLTPSGRVPKVFLRILKTPLVPFPPGIPWTPGLRGGGRGAKWDQAAQAGGRFVWSTSPFYVQDPRGPWGANGDQAAHGRGSCLEHLSPLRPRPEGSMGYQRGPMGTKPHKRGGIVWRTSPLLRPRPEGTLGHQGVPGGPSRTRKGSLSGASLPFKPRPEATKGYQGAPRGSKGDQAAQGSGGRSGTPLPFMSKT